LRNYPDPWARLAAIAARTDSVTLGTWVVPVPRRDPWQVGSEVATLDRISDGRVLFGAGLGNEEDYAAFGTPYEPATLGERFDEALEVISHLWAGGEITQEGPLFHLSGAEVDPTPLQDPRVRIVPGGWWPNWAGFDRGARRDGIAPYWPALTEGGSGPHDEEATGSPEDQLRDLLAYYTDVAEDPGEVVLPVIPSMEGAEMHALYRDLGATWVLETEPGDTYDAVHETDRDGPATV
jgi:hypothetical protein